jgi:hypothetical protein
MNFCFRELVVVWQMHSNSIKGLWLLTTQFGYCTKIGRLLPLLVLQKGENCGNVGKNSLPTSLLKCCYSCNLIIYLIYRWYLMWSVRSIEPLWATAWSEAPHEGFGCAKFPGLLGLFLIIRRCSGKWVTAFGAANELDLSAVKCHSRVVMHFMLSQVIRGNWYEVLINM